MVIIQMRSREGWDQDVNEEVSVSSGKKWSDWNIKTDALTNGLGEREREESGKNPRLVGKVEGRRYHLPWGRRGKFRRRKVLGGHPEGGKAKVQDHTLCYSRFQWLGKRASK